MRIGQLFCVLLLRQHRRLFLQAHFVDLGTRRIEFLIGAMRASSAARRSVPIASCRSREVASACSVAARSVNCAL